MLKTSDLPATANNSADGFAKTALDLATAQVLVLHGPNLNLLGLRERQRYGSLSLADLDARLYERARVARVSIVCAQHNAEHQLIDCIHAAGSARVRFILINPAAFTHTSIALRDALLATDIPFIEIHLSNVYAREAFRRQSFFSDLAQGVVCGLGTESYLYALDYALAQLNASAPTDLESSDGFAQA